MPEIAGVESQPSMATLSKNAEAADGLIAEINQKIQDVQRRISAKANVISNNNLSEEKNVVREEIKRWQQHLTLLQIRNGGVYYQLPLAPLPAPAVVASTGAGDGPAPVQKPAPPVAAEAETKPKAQEPGDKKPVKKETAPKPKVGSGPAPADDVVDVGRLDFRIGKIIEVDRHPDADTLYVEKVDIGEAALRTVVSGLVKHVPLEEMKDRMVVLLCNLKPAKMRGITSEAMVMCASTPEKVEILIPPTGSVPGDLIEFAGITRNADPVLNPKKKIFETVAPDLKTNTDRVATYKGIPFEVKGKGVVVSSTLVDVNIK